MITRPERDSRDIAEILHTQNYRVICTPFIEVITDDFTLPDVSAYAGLIFTSANAVRVLQGQDLNLNMPAFCVGSQTAEAAQQLGFTSIYNANGGVVELHALLQKHRSNQPYLYIRGRNISQDLKAIPPLNIKEIIAYHTDKIKEIPSDTAALLQAGQVSHILFFSTRTAQAFAEWAREENGVEAGLKQTKALCLGASMVESLSRIEWKDVQVAAHPTRESLLALLP